VPVTSTMRRRSLLLAVGWAVLTAPLHGQASGQQFDAATKLREFEVSSVKPSKTTTDLFRLHFTSDGVKIENASLLLIIRAAFGLFNSLDDKFLGIPGWAKTERFDIEAKVSPDDADGYRKLSIEQKQQMVQALLMDRFKLQAHRETKEQPIYFLVVAKGGSKLGDAKPSEINESRGLMTRSRDRLQGTGVVMSQIVSALTQVTERTVLDKTGLTGKYDFTLHWAPDEAGASLLKAANSGQPSNETALPSSGPSIFTAVEEQLGLRLEPAKGPVECLVIDHVEQPTEN
jgi:uncharacterized protein (TIGR03435 family)